VSRASEARIALTFGKEQYVRLGKKHLLGLTALLLLLGGLFSVPTTAARAALGIQVCETGQGSNPACLNGWGGGSALKVYSHNVFNDNFVYDFVSGRCNSGHTTTANCPISGVPAGLDIVQIKETYVANGTYECVGDTGGASGSALAETFDICNNDQTGFGGDYGTLFVLFPGSCPSPATALMNVHWSSS
jgi:hypothetical protein